MVWAGLGVGNRRATRTAVGSLTKWLHQADKTVSTEYWGSCLHPLLMSLSVVQRARCEMADATQRPRTPCVAIHLAYSDRQIPSGFERVDSEVEGDELGRL
jgi:hypothetical protein